MELSIHTRSIEITGALRDLISRRLHFALDVFGDRLRQASVHLADINGPRGGVDKSCQITVAIRGVGEVLARGTGDEHRGCFDACEQTVEIPRVRSGQTGSTTRY